MCRNNVSLCLPPHLLERLKQLADQEETSVNQLVTLAVAEKIAWLDAEAFYRAREGRSAPGAGWRAWSAWGGTLRPWRATSCRRRGEDSSARSGGPGISPAIERSAVAATGAVAAAKAPLSAQVPPRPAAGPAASGGPRAGRYRCCWRR